MKEVVAAVLIMDMSEFTGFTRRHGPHEARAAAHRFWALGRELTEAFGGTFVKGFGDDFMSTFPTVRQAYACAEAVMALIPSSGGVGFGAVLVEPGDAWGDEVNEASHEGEDRAKPGEIRPTAAVKALLNLS
jgi:class 3 adenylate cyclase